MTKASIVILLLGFCFWMEGQEDPVLMTIQGDPVYLSEFSYIYQKNNRDQADFSKESVQEYLELYKNFKLKVRKAKELGYNDAASYIEELAGYRKQLANGYFLDKEVIGKLADQILYRKQWDLRLSHILLKAPRNMPETDANEIIENLRSIRRTALSGQDFSELVKEFSEDEGSVPFGGDIGYITGLLPDGYLDFEDAAYELELNEISDIIRTDLGFHIITLTDRRPARGQMRAQHILVRNQKNGIPIADAERRIKEIQSQLGASKESFDRLATLYSEDAKTAPRGGDLGNFGIGRFESSFEDAAFALTTDGEVSEPFQTSLGWHIVRRMSKRDGETRKQIIESLEGVHANSLRVSKRKREVVEELKKEAPYVHNKEALDLFIDSTTSSIHTYNWIIPKFPDIEIASFGESRYTLSDFAHYGRSNSRIRLRNNKTGDVKDTVRELYEAYVEEIAIEYAQSRLEEKYLDFRNLMREYEEGILLFEITKNEVWDKASEDTLGLQNFYKENNHLYTWGERAELVTYTIHSSDKVEVARVYAMVTTATAEEVTGRFNQGEKLVTFEKETWELTSDAMKDLPAEEGHTSTPVLNLDKGQATCLKVEKILPPGLKTLKEARGYIVSDYQDLLERRWIESLNEEYKVVVHTDVLDSFITSE